MPVNLDPLSVRPDMIGDVFDLALGYQDPTSGLTRMVGYVVSPQGQFSEATDLQDEQHLVQVASPSSSDRFTRFPKVSQGDWSGGERQLIFEDATRYYSSTRLDTTVPGHLRIVGRYLSAVLPQAPQPQGVRAVSSDALRTFVLTSPSGLSTVLHGLDPVSFAPTITSVAAPADFSELLRGGDFMYIFGSGTGNNSYQVTDPTVPTLTQVTNDAAAKSSTTLTATSAYFGGSVYYLSTTTRQVHSATYAFPGAGAGTTAFTVTQMEANLLCLSSSATGLTFATGAKFGLHSYIYLFDGINQTFVGRIVGRVIDMLEADGIVYILTLATGVSSVAFQSQPTIYQLSGSTLSVFDDYRIVDADFQSTAHVGGDGAVGRLDSDGTYLYLFWPGLSVKRYRLATGAVYDVGNPSGFSSADTMHIGAVAVNGGFTEADNGTPATLTSLFIMNTLAPPVDNGFLVTSWFDFDTPLVDKYFKSIEFTFNGPPDLSALGIGFQTDAGIPFQQITSFLSVAGDTVIAYLPPATKGHRVRFEVVLSAVVNPDVQSYSVKATLARIWSTTVSCRRDQRGARMGEQDPQNLTSTQLLANIQNAYQLAGGVVTLYIPDPAGSLTMADGTVVLGVSQVNAEMEDYQRTTAPGVAPGMRQGENAYQIEADVQLTLRETL